MTKKALSFLKLLIVALALHVPSGISAKSAIGDLMGLNDVGIDTVNRLSQVIDQSFRSLDFLRREFDADVDDYISEIDRISAARVSELRDGVSDVGAIVEKTIDEIEAIRARAFYDARQLIWDVECLGTVYSEQLKTTLGEVIEILSDSEAEITFPLGLDGKLLIKSVDISSPDVAYEDIKAGYLEALEHVDEESSTLLILSSYGNISRVARMTSCNYRGLILAKYFFAEVAFYEGKSAPWAMLTGLDRF